MTSKSALALCLALAAGSVSAAEHTIEMKNNGADGTMVFEPAVTKVAVGDTINFVATDMAHNVESVEGMTPEGSVTWKGELSQGVTVTLDKEGVYVYKCTPHTMLGMVGVIVAGEPTNMDAINASKGKLTATIMANKERLDKYLAEVQ